VSGAGWSAAARAAAAHVFVDDLAAPRLAPDDVHHLTRVLRLRPGETVSVTDGAGGWRPTLFVTGGTLEPAGEAVWPAGPEPPITIAMAVPKGDRAEWAVQKLTELGVDRIVALTATHSVVRWDADRARRQLVRWQAVARQAAMQSRRLRLPRIEGPISVAEIVARGELRAGLAEPGGDAPDLDRPALLIGPEGGWAQDELACGLPTVALAPTVLRTETAAIAGATLLMALRASIVRRGDYE
jgi:16S rRNA (uracil1498-N3)-methyltransferase